MMRTVTIILAKTNPVSKLLRSFVDCGHLIFSVMITAFLVSLTRDSVIY